MPELFTIGHSTHSLEKFLGLLQLHRVEAVADVRSSPYSRFKGGIAGQTDKLIARRNVQARRGAHGRDKAVAPDWSRNWLRLKTFHEFLADLPFSRESWRGRIRACRWIGAALSRKQTGAFDREHEALLKRIAPARFTIPHRITIRIFELNAD